ncbi:DUF4646 domain-containing protein [Phanerochaete sordida]|uniref:DUF4646 domain-containing protein n=1 Tax=Phanerochaete sordida TaxID=48140 RepID=A0A9P3LFW3_9APHY|nr:DUF4646 domain-containing protein [Phanerochaete sordida]
MIVDSKEQPSEKSTSRLEYHEEDAPPAYEDEGKASPSNPFRGTASGADRRDEGADPRHSPYMPPAGPPPAFETKDMMPQPEYGYDQQPSRQPQGSPSMRSVPSSSTSSPVPPAAYAPYGSSPASSYTYGKSPYDQSGAGAGPSRVLLGAGLGAGPRGAAGGPISGLVGMLMGNDGVRDLLASPPPSFSRAPQQQFPYTAFPPLVAVSLDKNLDRGFPLLPPPSHLTPHPFMAHDVNEQDWTSFLGHIHQAAANPVASRVATGAGDRPGIIGTILSKGIEAAFRTDRSGPVSQLVEHWNAYFFHPRLMEVNLVHGSRVFTRSGRLPGDLARDGYTRGDESDDEDDSDSDYERPGNTAWTSEMMSRREQKRAAKRARRDAKRARREEKRAMRRERRDNRLNDRYARDEQWKLVITYRPPASARR